MSRKKTTHVSTEGLEISGSSEEKSEQDEESTEGSTHVEETIEEELLRTGNLIWLFLIE